MILWGGEDDVSTLSSGGRYALGLRDDADQDGVMVCQGDCDDTNPQVWATPGEVPSLTLAPAPSGGASTQLTWTPPGVTGSSAPLAYDLLRAPAPDASSSAICLVTDSSATLAADAEVPPVDTAFFYLVRARNACPSGVGSLGADSSGTPRLAPDCP
jgi:hypothetical protein